MNVSPEYAEWHLVRFWPDSAVTTEGGEVILPGALDLPLSGRAKYLAPMSLSPDEDQPAFVARSLAGGGVQPEIRFDSGQALHPPQSWRQESYRSAAGTIAGATAS
jgi:hypothetical protein